MTRGLSGIDRLARRALTGLLSRLEQGLVELVEGERREVFGGAGSKEPLRARLIVHHPSFYRRALLGGSIGAAEAYCDGLWSTDDLTALVRIFARNQRLSDDLDSGPGRLLKPLDRLGHLLRSNTRRGSRRNITAHYDLGEDFFSLFLDSRMMYSCAVFPRQESGLEEASLHKLEVICRKLQLRPDDEVVEIGGGWGGFALHAARSHGCRVTTTTISPRQFRYMRRRVAEEGLGERVEVLREDYRDLPGRLGRSFDKLVSIEMVEAVGHRYLPRYFQVVSDLLRPDGMALVQAIVIADQKYEAYRRSVDFIQKHIFPGGLLPSVSRMVECLRDRTDLRLFHLEDITPHYPRTLRLWRQRLNHQQERLRELGLDESFRRLWEYYFSYCEGGFLERTIGDVQLLLTKPLHRRPAVALELP